MAQVKFYSVASDATRSDTNGIYFVTGGELYKGTSRFGANKVWTVPANTVITGETAEAKLSAALTAAGVTGAIGGDILTGYGAAKVFNGTTWVDLGQDQAALDTQLSELVSGLAFASGTGSYITGITQDSTTGKVTASTSNFVTDVKTAVGDSTSTSTANGITVSVTTTSGVVTGVEVAAADISANSGTFTNLTVTSTATFSATTVSASTLTVGGVDVSNIAATSATDGTDGVAVTVSTANGGVTDVGVTITSASLLTTLGLTDFADKSLVTAIGPSSGTGAATDTQVPTALAVAKKLATLDNAMHFREVVASTGAISDPAKGDIVVIGANATTGFVEGQEYIYDGTKWELIGDQRTYAVNAYTSTASVYSGVTNVPGALNAVGAAADTFQAALDAKVTTTAGVSDSTKASNLVTAGAVADYVAQEITALGTAASKNFADTLVSTGTSLPTESAVAGYVTTVVEGLDASVSSSENNSIQVGVTQVDGKVTAVTADLVWLDASGAAIA